MIFRWLFGVALLFAILIWLLPNKGENADARIVSTSMLACAMDYREQVGRQLAAKVPVNARFMNKCPNVIAAVEVAEQGDIVISGTQHRLKLTLSPLMDNGKIHWSCRGEPANAVTKLCKP